MKATVGGRRRGVWVFPVLVCTFWYSGTLMAPGMRPSSKRSFGRTSIITKSPLSTNCLASCTPAADPSNHETRWLRLTTACCRLTSHKQLACALEAALHDEVLPHNLPPVTQLTLINNLQTRGRLLVSSAFVISAHTWASSRLQPW